MEHGNRPSGVKPRKANRLVWCPRAAADLGGRDVDLTVQHPTLGFAGLLSVSETWEFLNVGGNVVQSCLNLFSPKALQCAACILAARLPNFLSWPRQPFWGSHLSNVKWTRFPETLVSYLTADHLCRTNKNEACTMESWSHGVICSCRLMQDLSWNECTFGAELGMMTVWAECCMMRVFLRWVSANQAWIVHSNCTSLDGRYLWYVQFNWQGYWMADPWAQTGHSVIHQLHHESQQSSRIGQEHLAFESATMHLHRHVILRVHYGGGKSRELCDSISVGVACAFVSPVSDSIQERSDQHIHLPSNWGRNPNVLLFALFRNVLGFQVQMQRPCSNSGIF